MTTTVHHSPDVLVPARSPLSVTDRTYDLSESCARCGRSTQAQSKWVFPPLRQGTKDHLALYLCAHCSRTAERQLLAASILRLDRP